MSFRSLNLTRARIFIFVVIFSLLSPAVRADLWNTGYYPGYRQTVMPPTAIDFTALTHIIHFSAIPTTTGTLDTAPNSMTFTRATNLVAIAHAAKRKVLFSVGPAGGDIFTNAASTANLSTFINNLTNLMVGRGYDGIDIDWEPITSSDATRFTAFINTLRTSLDTITPRPLLTIAVYTQPSLIGALHSKFDQINIMTYGMSGAYPGWITWHNSPLYDGGITFPSVPGKHVPSTEATINSFTNAGVPLGKLGIGIGFYGCMWSGGAGTTTGGATKPAQSYTNDPVTSEVAFSTIMSTYYQTNLYHWDTNAQSPYLSIDNTGSANDKFISYDDEHSCQAKVSYARNRGLGGLMIWELGEGYRSTEPVGKKDPLLQALKASFATPRITSVARSNQNITFSFTSLPLASYRVQWSSNLNSGVWNTLSNNVSGTGGVLQITDSNAPAQSLRFYRVRTPP
jgi:chitinase